MSKGYRSLFSMEMRGAAVIVAGLEWLLISTCRQEEIVLMQFFRFLKRKRVYQIGLCCLHFLLIRL